MTIQDTASQQLFFLFRPLENPLSFSTPTSANRLVSIHTHNPVGHHHYVYVRQVF